MSVQEDKTGDEPSQALIFYNKNVYLFLSQTALFEKPYQGSHRYLHHRIANTL